MNKKSFNSQLHKQFLIKILLDIFKELGGKIGFKGGTCAFLFYDLPRLSLDLDFDILKPLTEKDIDTLKKVFTKYTKIKDFYDKTHTLFFLLDYQAHTPNIKIEFNKRQWKSANYKNFWLLGVKMQIVDKPTLLAGKLLALAGRRQPVARDLFDAYYFLKTGFPINKAFIEEISGQTLKAYLRSLIPFIKKCFNSKNVLYGLGEVLDTEQKKWAKDRLSAETQIEIKNRF